MDGLFPAKPSIANKRYDMSRQIIAKLDHQQEDESWNRQICQRHLSGNLDRNWLQAGKESDKRIETNRSTGRFRRRLRIQIMINCASSNGHIILSHAPRGQHRVD